jgi:hypothetical protein
MDEGVVGVGVSMSINLATTESCQPGASIGALGTLNAEGWLLPTAWACKGRRANPKTSAVSRSSVTGRAARTQRRRLRSRVRSGADQDNADGSNKPIGYAAQILRYFHDTPQNHGTAQLSVHGLSISSRFLGCQSNRQQFTVVACVFAGGVMLRSHGELRCEGANAVILSSDPPRAVRARVTGQTSSPGLRRAITSLSRFKI